MNFDLNNFVEECISASKKDNYRDIILDLVKNAVSNPKSLTSVLGKPNKSTYDKIFVSDDLVVVNVVWSPGLSIVPHNHNSWAVIGVYAGQEKNIFWQKITDDENGKIQEHGSKIVAAGEVAKFGNNIIHSITNPTNEYTGALHIYGGNIFKLERSQWNTTTLHEAPYDSDKAIAGFDPHKINSDASCLENINITSGEK